jgi:hypothetical protein
MPSSSAVEGTRGGLRQVGIVTAGVAVLGLFLVVVAGARPEVPTLGLLLVGLALVGCLRALHRIVGALVRDDLAVVVDTASEYGGASQRELREERRRLLRAINELRFDHEMGKLSQVDYDAVRQGYELRAIEVMRQLEGGESLHPGLAARLGLATPAADPGPDAADPGPDAAADPIAVTKADPDDGAEAGDASAPPDPPVIPEDDVTSRACAACDGINDADARFCKHCGKELAA